MRRPRSPRDFHLYSTCRCASRAEDAPTDSQRPSMHRTGSKSATTRLPSMSLALSRSDLICGKVHYTTYRRGEIVDFNKPMPLAIRRISARFIIDHAILLHIVGTALSPLQAKAHVGPLWQSARSSPIFNATQGHSICRNHVLLATLDDIRPSFSDRLPLAGAGHRACCCGAADRVSMQVRAASPYSTWYTSQFREVCKLGTHWSMASDSVQLPTRTHT